MTLLTRRGAIATRRETTGATTGWLRGSAGQATEAGTFASWAGYTPDLVGTWSDGAPVDQINVWGVASGGTYANWVGPIDIAVGAIWKPTGETWAAAASGSYDARWTQCLTNLRTYRQGKGTTYIRFGHEFSYSGVPWSVTSGEVTNYKTAWSRFRTLQKSIFPTAKLVWCPNAGQSTGVDIRQAYPGAGQVDVYGVDAYNHYPAVNTVAGFNTQINMLESTGAPRGIQRHYELAQSYGLPFAITEWSTDGDPASEGQGLDAPVWMQAYFDWLQSHDVLYEVLFNLSSWPQFVLYGPGVTTKSPLAAAKYAALWKTAVETEEPPVEPPPTVSAPATILNIGTASNKNHFKVQIARNGASTYAEITQDQIAAGFTESPYFYTTPDNARVHFQARMDGPTTSGSDYARSELRQVNADGTNFGADLASTSSGTWDMSGTSVITHQPPTKPEIVIAQLHNGDADQIAVRTQTVGGVNKIVVRVNGSIGNQLGTGGNGWAASGAYTVGTPVSWRIRTVNGAVTVWINGTQVVSGVTLTSTGSASWYGKAGCYNQSNETLDSATEYGAVELSALTCTYTAGTGGGTGTAGPLMGVSSSDEDHKFAQWDAVRVYKLSGAKNDAASFGAKVVALSDDQGVSVEGGANSATAVKNFLEDFYYGSGSSARQNIEIHYGNGNEVDRDYPSGTLPAAYVTTTRLISEAVKTKNADGSRRYPKASMWVDMTQNNIRNSGAGARFRTIAPYLDGFACSMYPPGRQSDPVVFTPYATYCDEVFSTLADWRTVNPGITQFATWEFGIPIDHALKGMGAGGPTASTNYTIRPRYVAGGNASNGTNYLGFLQHVYNKCQSIGVTMREQIYWDQQSAADMPNQLVHDFSPRANPDTATAWHNWTPGSRLPNG